MEYRCDILVPQSTSRLGFAQKTVSGGLVYTTDRIHDLQGDWAFQTSVIGLISDTHTALSQFPQTPVGPLDYFVMLVPVVVWHYYLQQNILS
jgi:hypothetical protein